MKKVKEIMKIIEDFAPVNLKEDFDNVGLMVGDKEKEVKKILLALDCTLDVINEGKEKNVDLIITHHPLLFRKPSNITTDTLLGKKIIELIKNDISLYSSHTNLDSVEGGLNETIVEKLGFNSTEIIEIHKNSKDKKDGLGRIIRLKNNISLLDLVRIVKENLNINTLKIVEGFNNIRTIAIINGSGEGFISEAVKMGADCIITGDTTYHFASDYKEMGISIIDTGHFSSEWVVFLSVMDKIKKDLDEIEVIISNKVEDPYTFV
ncbi:Nif3-like dinuclear metal center hexameric protein [Clostridium carnis]